MACRLSLCLIAISLSVPAFGVAQDRVEQPRIADLAPTVDPPAHISLVDGAAVLERDGQSDPAPSNMPLLAGDRVRTDTGRVEILFADGSTLHLDVRTTVDFLSDELVRVLEGRIRLSIPGPNRRVAYRIDAPSGSAEIAQPGEYRIAVVRGDEIELAVLRGAADLVNENGRTTLRAGERAFARANAAPSYAYVFNSATWDAFDRWSETRRDQRLAVSSQYLPNEVRPYASSFDRYGDWRYESTYGHVWYPTVPVGWRPYYNGRWATLRPYGWTWIGSDAWSWPTHHYGRWGISAGVWFWIPGRTWGPAWVSWADAPGYISWCPLGWNNRPIVQLINVRGSYDPWHAWTVVPRRHFGPSFVNVRGVAVRPLDSRTRGAFVPRTTPPDYREYAVPRSFTPIRAAGTVAPRSPVYTNLGPSESRVGGSRTRVMVGAPPTSPASRSASTPGTPSAPTERTRAVPRSTPADPGDARVLPGPQVAGTPAEGRRPASADDRYGARRAVPREDRVYGSPGLPAERSRGIEVDRGAAGVPSPTALPLPRSREVGSPGYRSEVPERPVYGDRLAYGDGRSAGVPRAVTREAAPPPPPPPGVDRRGPAPDRPSGPPPSARDSGPRDSGSRADGGRSRSGGQSSQGTAVPRRGGGR